MNGNLDIPNLGDIRFADLKDPFKTDSFDMLNICVTKYSVSAEITFVDGHTDGRRTFTAPTMENLMIQLNDYMAALKAKSNT